MEMIDRKLLVKLLPADELYEMGFDWLVFQEDARKAAFFIQASVDKGNYPPALTTLAMMHENGQGVSQDSQKSLELSLRAAEQNHVPAMLRCYQIFHELGNESESMKWLLKSVDRGSVFAKHVLWHKDKNDSRIEPELAESFERTEKLAKSSLEKKIEKRVDNPINYRNLTGNRNEDDGFFG